mgnify:CR=1 FL=1
MQRILFNPFLDLCNLFFMWTQSLEDDLGISSENQVTCRQRITFFYPSYQYTQIIPFTHRYQVHAPEDEQ